MNLLMKTVRRTTDELHMFDPGDGVVVGISGGPDSTVLLHALHQMREERDVWLVAVHVNHGLRGEESIRDAEFARGQTEGLRIPFELLTLESLGKGDGSIQQKARDERYRCFRDVARSRGARRIAVGHHADDCVEWALMNLLQGSGMSGLRGIPPTRGEVIRPLIRVRKSEILAYLAQEGIPCVEDSSNRSLSYLRNRVRHSLLPFLEEHFNPRVRDALLRIVAIAGAEDAFLANEAEKAFTHALVERGDGAIRMDRGAVAALDPALQARIIRHAAAALTGTTQGFTFDHIRSVMQIIGKRGRARTLHLPGGITAGVEYGSLLIEKHAEDKKSGFYHVIAGPGTFRLSSPGLRFTFSLQPSARGTEIRQCPPERAYLDADQCTFPLTIRSSWPGDRFYPLGVGAPMKLKDFFISQRIPRSVRARTPLLISQKKIAWVVGLRLDERFKVERRCSPVLTVDIAPEGNT